MNSTKYRTHATPLTNDELLILDVMFWVGATPSQLRRKYFRELWNAQPHSLDDEALQQTLHHLLRTRILAESEQEWRGQRYLRMTKSGGNLWSAERCPVWERYCTERYKDTSRGRTLMSVTAVSATVRDDFLRLWPEYPARRRKAEIRDFGLIEWRSFGTLHVGIATYEEQREWSCTEFAEYQKQYEEYANRLNADRTWWRSVDELQRFVGNSAKA